MTERTPVQILYISGFADIAGGGQLSFLLLLKYLDRKIFSPAVLLPARGEMAERLEEMSVPFITAGYPRLRSLKIWKTVSFVLRLRDIILARHAAIVHCDTPDMALMAACACRLAGAKLVFHARVSDRYRFDRTIAGLADAVICVSAAAAKRFALSPKSVVVKNGADTRLFSPDDTAEAKKRFGFAADDFVIGYAGQLIKEKGLDTLARAFALAGKTVPNLRLIIIGRGEFEPQLRGILKQNGCMQKTVFTGFIKNSADALKAMDALVFPSRADEGLSRVVVESMACAKPAVVSDSGGNAETVRDGKDGFVIKHDDPRLYAEKIILLAGDKTLAAELGGNARQRVLDFFDAATTAQNVQNVYAAILRK